MIQDIDTCWLNAYFNAIILNDRIREYIAKNFTQKANSINLKPGCLKNQKLIHAFMTNIILNAAQKQTVPGQPIFKVLAYNILVECDICSNPPNTLGMDSFRNSSIVYLSHLKTFFNDSIYIEPSQSTLDPTKHIFVANANGYGPRNFPEFLTNNISLKEFGYQIQSCILVVKGLTHAIAGYTRYDGTKYTRYIYDSLDPHHQWEYECDWTEITALQPKLKQLYGSDEVILHTPIYMKTSESRGGGAPVYKPTEARVTVSTGKRRCVVYTNQRGTKFIRTNKHFVLLSKHKYKSLTS